MKTKHTLYLIVVPILVSILGWFFYTLNESFQEPTESKTITISDNGIVKNLELENYIIGVVACEMPASFEIDALKAQAIAARTYAAYKILKSNLDYDVLTTIDDQCYIDEDMMKEKWGNDYEIYYKKIKSAVMETANTVMLKDNDLFKAFYFSTSNGYTEDSKTVFREANIASVSSLWDKENKEYRKETIFTYTELSKILGSFKNIKINKRNETNHITSIFVDEKEYTGIEFRHLLNLRSTDFTIKQDGKNYIITTYGYGHGVGMSQYGANSMAKDNKNYEEILNYYYSGVEFSKL